MSTFTIIRTTFLNSPLWKKKNWVSGLLYLRRNKEKDHSTTKRSGRKVTNASGNSGSKYVPIVKNRGVKYNPVSKYRIEVLSKLWIRDLRVPRTEGKVLVSDGPKTKGNTTRGLWKELQKVLVTNQKFVLRSHQTLPFLTSNKWGIFVTLRIWTFMDTTKRQSLKVNVKKELRKINLLYRLRVLFPSWLTVDIHLSVFIEKVYKN